MLTCFQERNQNYLTNLPWDEHNKTPYAPEASLFVLHYFIWVITEKLNKYSFFYCTQTVSFAGLICPKLFRAVNVFWGNFDAVLHVWMSPIMSRDERFVSRYIAKAIYCIIWKHQKISQYLKVSRYFYDIFNAGFWSILAFFWTCKQLQFDNLVVYLQCEL